MANKAKVYLETTIPSYVMARPSRDLVRAAEQEITRAWWEMRESFDLYASELVIEEVSAGDAEAAAQRLEALAGVALLGMTPDAEALAAMLVAEAALPARAAIDALHIAVAARAAGFEPPVICTPMELLQE